MQQAIAMRAVSAFSTTGIHPFNPDIFTDDDYAGADVSDRPITSDPIASTSAAPAVMTSAVGGSAWPRPAVGLAWLGANSPARPSWARAVCRSRHNPACRAPTQ